MPEAPLRIDVISDFVCPWCWIGKRGVDAFMKLRPVERQWQPYFLHPGLPPEGMERETLMRMKFGPQGAGRAMVDTIAEAAAGVGLEIDYTQIERVPNTLDAHRLCHWASGQGRGDEIAEALFRAYFSEGRDIGERAVLVEIGTDGGLDGDVLSELFDSDADCAQLTARAEDMRDRGIPGVPSHLIAGKGLLVGAQTPEAFAEAEERLAA